MSIVDKRLSHFKSIELSFESFEHMYNIASNAVLLESIASDISINKVQEKRSMKILCLKGYMERKAVGKL